MIRAARQCCFFQRLFATTTPWDRISMNTQHNLIQLIKAQSGAKYMQIASGIEQAIHDFVLQSGDQLPPQRDLADLLGVTLGTVSRGYREAEKRGLLQGETGRGTFVRTKEPDRFSLHSLHNMPERDSMGAIQFDLNFPVPLGNPDLNKALKAIAERTDLHEMLDYRPTFGLIRHRLTGVEWLKRFGITTRPEQLAITAGVQHGLQTVLSSMMDCGESLAVEQYTYPGVLNLAHHLGIRLVPVPMDQEGMRPEALLSIARQHTLKGVYMMPTLQNPTTVTMSAKRREEIAAAITELNLFLVEDDVYGVLGSNSLTPLSASIPERAFYLTSLSKALAPGLRVGFLVMPSRKSGDIEAAMAASIWHTPPLMAEIACQWIRDGTAERIITVKRDETTRRTNIVKQLLPGRRLFSAAGGAHLWLYLPEGWQGDAFAQEAAQGGVMVIPSVNFFPGPHPEHQAVRICVGPPQADSEIRRGATLLEQLLSQKPVTHNVII